ncbi:MAG: thioredoxin domain-containing protein, partial [Terriglobales bacterium]
QRMMNQNNAKAEKITDMPVLFVQGMNDRLVKPLGTVTLFKRLKTQDKNLVMVGTAEHLIFEQNQFNDAIIQLVSSWVDKNVVSKRLATMPGVAVGEQSRSKSADGATADDSTREGLGHLKIAPGYLLLNDPTHARDHLLTTLSVSRGSGLAVQADKLLLALPETLIAPPVGPGTRSAMSLVSLDAAKANDKPTVLLFCAPWIQSCKALKDDLNSALGADLDQVNVVEIDADEPKNEPILKEYGIKPLPAILYLNSVNEVMSYTLGDPGLVAIQAKIRLLLDGESRISKQP